jgi:large subunit ribosomal protein L32
MPVPKRKTSQSRRDKRRAQQKLDVQIMSFCPQCKSPKLPHRACPKCGTYKGREVIPLGADTKKS